MKSYLIAVLALFFSISLYAQSSEMIVSAPSVVAVGEPFKVEFKLQNKPSNFQIPLFKGFDMVAGPTESSSRSISIINGKQESKSEFTFTCVLIALEKGITNIESASATVDGKEVKSRQVPIEVVGDGGRDATSTGSAKTIAKDDMQLLMSVNKSTVYKGEAVVVTIKLVTRVDLAGVESAKYPSFDGFWTQELKIPDDQQWLRENLNDKIYNTRIISRYLLFPQTTGELKIDKMSMELVAQIVMNSPAQRRSIFDDFFGGGASVQNIKRKVESKEIKINVLNLPESAPLSFDGAVGEFNMSSKLSSDLLSANSSGNVTVVISGNGNLPLISEPKIDFSNSFEVYNVKSTDNYTVSKGGAIGSKSYDFPFIARAAGKYSIPALEFTYFNPKTKKYITLNGGELELSVSVDTTSNNNGEATKVFTGVTKQELKILGSDIKYIDIDFPEIRSKNSFFIGSWLFYFIILFIFGVGFLISNYLRKNIKFRKDIVKVRSSKARKIALSRLKGAKVLMENEKSNQFYQEILKAMWGYVSDKLNIELALLSKSNIDGALAAKGVEDEFIKNYISVIEQCEFAQYAPSSDSSMSEIYNKSIDVISNLEDKI